MKMKSYIPAFKYMIIASVLVFSSCNDYLDINDDPNFPTEAPITGLMINSTFETSENTYRMGNMSSNYVQYIASPNAASSSDVMDPVSYDTYWFNLYNVMTDLTDLIAKAETLGATHYVGAGQILMAYNLGLTVDTWGSVPYSEGFDFETFTPAYDSDEELYGQILSMLNSGLSNLSKETGVSLGDDDFIYSGDVKKWINFGNMLKARYLNHYSDLGSYDPTAVLQALEKGFESNADDAQVSYFEEEFNPWYTVAKRNEDLLLQGWISEQFIQALDGTTFGIVDPRLPLMISTTADGKYVGTVNGAGRGAAPEQGARSVLEPDDFYTQKLGPIFIATYAEQKFIEAEAAFTIDKNRSYTAYLAGIRAHMEKLGVAAAEIDTYINNVTVSMGVGAFTKDAIFKEKWVALFLNPETWVDARRHDYGYKNFSLPANLNSNLNNQFIRRLQYPDSEVSRNGKNVPKVTLLDRVFWDK